MFEQEEPAKSGTKVHESKIRYEDNCQVENKLVGVVLNGGSPLPLLPLLIFFVVFSRPMLTNVEKEMTQTNIIMPYLSIT